jgi:hypothetical protein
MASGTEVRRTASYRSQNAPKLMRWYVSRTFLMYRPIWEEGSISRSPCFAGVSPFERREGSSRKRSCKASGESQEAIYLVVNHQR